MIDPCTAPVSQHTVRVAHGLYSRKLTAGLGESRMPGHSRAKAVQTGPKLRMSAIASRCH
jgi:hypothetical protein